MADVEGVLHVVGGALVGAGRPCRHQQVAPVPLLQQGGQAEARLFGVAGLAPQDRPAPQLGGDPHIKQGAGEEKAVGVGRAGGGGIAVGGKDAAKRRVLQGAVQQQGDVRRGAVVVWVVQPVGVEQVRRPHLLAGEEPGHRGVCRIEGLKV